MKISAAELRERLRHALRLLDDPHPGLSTWTDMLQGAMLDVRDAGNRWWDDGISDVDRLEPIATFRTCTRCGATVSSSIRDEDLLGCSTPDRAHVWGRR